MNHLFDQIRARMPDGTAPFLTTADSAVLTYADLLVRTGRIAHALVALGVAPGDRVAVQAEKSPEALLLYLATVRAGAVFLPLNPAYTAREVGYFLADSEPRLVVCDPRREGEVAAVAPAAAVLATLNSDGAGSLSDEAAALPPDFADVPRGPDDLAAILYTSGTTGRAKGAMLTHENLASNARALVDAWRFTRDDVLVHALPIFHTHGLFVATNVALFAGASMLFFPRFDPADVVAAFAHATVLMGVPTFYVRLLGEPGLTADATRGMRLFISGSAPLLAETHAAWRSRTGHAILERYGMTETSMNTSNPYAGERRAGTVGLPLAGVEVRIADPATGAPLAAGEIGMIEVRGPNIFRGYWRMPERTAGEFRQDGFFITGDLGVRDADGYVAIVGRSKDLIISGGFNVYPKEVEMEIDRIPGVVESAVIGLPHGDFGEAVTAVVVADPGASDEAALIAALAGRLARYKQPKRCLFVASLPRNAMGKVQKAELRRIYAHLYT